jgi:PiT family inorganic phosphate transporter
MESDASAVIILLWLSIGLCLLFAFTNGMNDGSVVYSTAVASGSMSRRKALLWVSLAEFCGPFLFGVPVALTMARGIIRVDMLPLGAGSVLLVLCGVMGAILWNLFSWSIRLPSSSSFALVGGMIGPMLYRYGAAGIPWSVFLTRVIGGLFISPLLGMLFGALVYRLLVRMLRNAPWKANVHLKRAQLASLLALGLNHGTNDSQKSMGLIVLLLVLAGRLSRLSVPFWVLLASAGCLTLGVALGGTRIVRTVGYGIFRVRPIHSFSAELAAALVLLSCNLLGAPVSTTQVVSSSVIGVGNAHRRNAVRWAVIRNIFLSWVLTIPLAGALSAGLYWALARLLGGILGG